MCMKKSLFVLGVAVAALASCTNEEVMEVAQNRAISFSSFVNNNTRTVTEINSTSGLTSSQFYVFGKHGASTGSYDDTNFNNELGSSLYYWDPSTYYAFGAYADGAAGKIDNATFDASTQTLSFLSYTPDDTKDLVAATATTNTSTDVSSVNAVELTFKHMLAQVAFEFNTNAADVYELKIKDVKINGAISTANGTFTQTGGAVWATDGATSNGYIYEDFEGEGVDIANESLTPVKTYAQSKLVIPQALPTTSGQEYTVTFTATLHDTNDGDDTTNDKSQDFTAKLSFTKNNDSSTYPNEPESNKWTAGYRYKYTATIEPDDIDDELTDKEIIFTATVEDWIDASDTGMTVEEATAEP